MCTCKVLSLCIYLFCEYFQVKHKSITVAGVKLTDIDDKDADLLTEYIESRKQYLIQSSEEKYGSSVHG